ncbi:MAG: hypothetical protein H6598_03490 [Flavobacteriales bacterium]|nr:hypothetical protein [Flavobacteriales bacterium]
MHSQKPWEQFKKTNTTQFFDGIVSLIELPDNFPLHLYNITDSLNKNEASIKTAILDLHSVSEAHYWGEIELTTITKHYFETLKYIFSYFEKPEKKILAVGVELLFEYVDQDQIEAFKLQIKRFSPSEIEGYLAPDDN